MMARIEIPRTYAQWVDVFELLQDKTDDAAVLEAMQQGTIEWQSGVAERFTSKLVDVINKRMNAASDKFQREISRAHGQEREIVGALLALRKEMKFLSQAINLPAIPEKDRKQYSNLVLEQADNMQRSLEDSAKNDRTGKLASIIKNNRVNAF